MPGDNVARMLKPDAKDYFVLKPKQSAFFGTTLDTLLRDSATKTLILTGIAGNNCVLFSANDAYMRDFKLFIPSDCVASNTERENHYALQLMKKVRQGGHHAVQRARPRGAAMTLIRPLVTIEDRSSEWPVMHIGNEWSRRYFGGPFYAFDAPPVAPAISLVFVQTRDGNTGASIRKISAAVRPTSI